MLSIIEYLTAGKFRAFSKFKEILNKDINKYIASLKKIEEAKKSDKNKISILNIKMKKFFEEISLENSSLETFVKNVFSQKGIIDKTNVCIFGQQADNVWDFLTDSFDITSESKINIQELLNNTDSDILTYCCDIADLSIYQAINELSLIIKSDTKDLAKNLANHYCNQYTNIISNIDKVSQHYNNKKFTLLTMNEYFWGKVPFDNTEAVALGRQWSTSLNNGLFCTHFLLKNETKEVNQEYLQKHAEELKKLYIPSDYDSSKYESFKDPIKNKLFVLMESEFFGKNSKESAFQTYLRHLEKISPECISGVFRNESIIFFNGQLLTSYDKATYYNEQEELFRRGYIYKLGTGNDELVTKENEIANLVFQVISTQICRDSVAGVRQNDKRKQKLHILQSNTIKFDEDAIPSGSKYVVHANFNSPAAIYKRSINFNFPDDLKSPKWDPVGPFDWHLCFKLGASSYSI